MTRQEWDKMPEWLKQSYRRSGAAIREILKRDPVRQENAEKAKYFLEHGSLAGYEVEPFEGGAIKNYAKEIFHDEPVEAPLEPSGTAEPDVDEIKQLSPSKLSAVDLIRAIREATPDQLEEIKNLLGLLWYSYPCPYPSTSNVAPSQWPTHWTTQGNTAGNQSTYWGPYQVTINNQRSNGL